VPHQEHNRPHIALLVYTRWLKPYFGDIPSALHYGESLPSKKSVGKALCSPRTLDWSLDVGDLIDRLRPLFAQL
jgi:hypothetical protein